MLGIYFFKNIFWNCGRKTCRSIEKHRFISGSDLIANTPFLWKSLLRKVFNFFSNDFCICRRSYQISQSLSFYYFNIFPTVCSFCLLTVPSFPMYLLNLWPSFIHSSGKTVVRKVYGILQIWVTIMNDTCSPGVGTVQFLKCFLLKWVMLILLTIYLAWFRFVLIISDIICSPICVSLIQMTWLSFVPLPLFSIFSVSFGSSFPSPVVQNG